MSNFEWSPIKDFNANPNVKKVPASMSKPYWFYDTVKGTKHGNAITYHQDYNNGNHEVEKGTIVFLTSEGERLENVTHFMPVEIPAKPKKETEQKEQN